LFEVVKGQKIAIQMLVNDIKAQTLPQTLLLYGPDGCGKFLTAIEVARIVNCENNLSSHCNCSSCIRINNFTSTNLYIISRSNLRNTFELWNYYGVKKENKECFFYDLRRFLIFISEEQRYNREYELINEMMNNEENSNFKDIIGKILSIIDSQKGRYISIDTIRNLQRYLWMRSGSGKCKVVIIDGAESMNEEAANSFLKISEETPGDSIIILTAVNRDLLKETIRSRARSYRFVHLNNKVRRDIAKMKFQQDDDMVIPTLTYKPEKMRDYYYKIRADKNSMEKVIEVVEKIVESDQSIGFLDYTIDMLKKEIKNIGIESIEKIYELESLIKRTLFTKNAILYSNANPEVALTDFTLNYIISIL